MTTLDAVFKDKCPHCKQGELEVVSGVFTATGMTLSKDGFAFQEAKQVDTSDEVVQCTNPECGRAFPLAEVTL